MGYNSHMNVKKIRYQVYIWMPLCWISIINYSNGRGKAISHETKNKPIVDKWRVQPRIGINERRTPAARYDLVLVSFSSTTAELTDSETANVRHALPRGIGVSRRAPPLSVFIVVHDRHGYAVVPLARGETVLPTVRASCRRKTPNNRYACKRQDSNKLNSINLKKKTRTTTRFRKGETP